jgi:hypothetical protein
MRADALETVGFRSWISCRYTVLGPVGLARVIVAPRRLSPP